MTFWKHRFTIDRSGWRGPWAVVAAAVFACGLWWHNAALVGGGSVMLCFLLRRVGSDQRPARRFGINRGRRSKSAGSTSDSHAENGAAVTKAEHSAPPAPRQRPIPGGLPKNTDALV